MLRDIQFAEKDPSLIESQIITLIEKYMSEEGDDPVKLYRSDPRRLLALAFIAGLVHMRNLVDHTGKMNLLSYATGDFLDHQGHQLAVKRLEATAATTTLRFELSEALSQPYIVPIGTRATPDGQQYFATLSAVEIPAGQRYIDISAGCIVPGRVGNGWLPGQINRPVDRLPWIRTVQNITPSNGGADEENDENFRLRIQLAPEYFSVAGPSGAYEYWARTAHPGIVDVAIVGPPEIEPGNVEIYPLMADGELPSQEILDIVYTICSAEDIRPLTDYVHVLPPAPIPYTLRVTYWLERSRATQAAAIQVAVEQSARNWIAWQRSKLGRDLNPSELSHQMVAAGAKRVKIESPDFTVLKKSQVAVASDVQILFGGLEDG